MTCLSRSRLLVKNITMDLSDKQLVDSRGTHMDPDFGSFRLVTITTMVSRLGSGPRLARRMGWMLRRPLSSPADR